MSEKRPQPTLVLIKRLRRVATWLDDLAEHNGTPAGLFQKSALKARANTCWQVAGRLEEIENPDVDYESE